MKNIIILFALIGLLASCSDEFLEKEPFGELTDDQVELPENIESLVISAYSILNGQGNEASNAFNSPASNWSFGDVLSDDAYKGGGGTGDQNQIHRMEIYNIDGQIIDVVQKWSVLYEGVYRANTVLKALKNTTEFDEATKTQRVAEMRFLRGHFYFELKKLYNRISYTDEDGNYLSNTQITPEEIWTKIEDDFNAAIAVLPETQADPGRPTKYAAWAYLSKTYLYQGEWQLASDAADEVISKGGYSLTPNFSEIFIPENDNGEEVVFAIQYSINDGSPSNYNGSIGDRLMPPGGPRYAAYGFLRPSQNLVNAYKTDVEGMPIIGNDDVTESDNVDPRLDVTIGRPGIPYKDLEINYEESWARDLATYGPYGPKKRVISANHPAYLQSWPYVTAANYSIIRYADVLLWKAEAEIELENLEEGRTYINMIRERAKTGIYIQNLEGTANAANYLIDTYDAPFASKEEATIALRTERRLEMAHEGHRFFDLVRWGIAADVINTYLAKEQIARGFLTGATFVAGKHEYMPIPQSQIDAGGKDESGNALTTQNPGY
ncbi:RagB/SusD family nutrient uptake outer membrane protein [Arenibacter sp. F20364]|uniref:RagB/SusD family nutrient uptake outer membrane protein n=1 Tax=Arenibacter sp. F20364 TaxID=2926415 RepID=UPI001FF24251|nr:RagB/SusD family nutrient uptake outer membrane protein [Arenibacter sp. F20364]MCK0192071.1 RagB/SusD family nutrient uptake outer membrane protein [Arenibacter sp. F20364]